MPEARSRRRGEIHIDESDGDGLTERWIVSSNQPAFIADVELTPAGHVVGDFLEPARVCPGRESRLIPEDRLVVGLVVVRKSLERVEHDEPAPDLRGRDAELGRLPPLKHPASTMTPRRSSVSWKISRRIRTIPPCVCAQETLAWTSSRRLTNKPRRRYSSVPSLPGWSVARGHSALARLTPRMTARRASITGSGT